ncbi:hypothetical protein GCM10011489_06530 [Gordonia jinhuaensis]|uniref:HTH marR-type domain-containing protein n=1 Tax=Gordonia jinhuaensis TaxID=1517702 RepID=A0A916SX81_9ACTN|nr:hypothetical protein GCM10011489_06530 [Gordonia jinhuaensis]
MGGFPVPSNPVPTTPQRAPSPEETSAMLFDFMAHLGCISDARALDSIMHTELSLSHFRVLMQLRLYAHPVPLHELAEATSLSLASTGRNVDKLVHLGLVDRREDPRDRRVKLVSVTEKGRHELDEMSGRRDDAVREILRQLPVDLRVGLHQSLDAIVNGGFWDCPPGASHPTRIPPARNTDTESEHGV